MMILSKRLECEDLRERLAIEQRKYESRVEQHEECVARLAEEVENAATYKQERDEIYVNYETVAAKLSEAHRQNADLMAIIDKRDEALGFIPLDKGMDMQDELREVKARLAEREAQLAEYENIIIPSWKREEDMWREDEANAIEFRRVLAEELDKRDADITRLKAWLRDYQPRPADSASVQRDPPCPHGRGWDFCEKCVEGLTIRVTSTVAGGPDAE